MKSGPEDISRMLALLTQAPPRLENATAGLQATQLYLRTEAEPWSVSDILAHLRACTDMWGNSIMAMITQDNPTLRYVSPRAWMRKPQYLEQEFHAALTAFTQERKKLVKALADLDQAGWARGGNFTGTSSHQRAQTVWSYAERIVNHEQPHLIQIEVLLPRNQRGEQLD